MSALKELMKLSSDTTQPALFMGHGSPMNIVYDNQYTRFFKDLGETLHVPKAILVVSAHWLTSGSKVLTVERPKQIYDFYGFPEPLYSVQYQPPGAPLVGAEISKIGSQILASEEWGLDHGSWSILHHMYPKQNVPVLQLSIDRNLSPKEHLRLAQQLKPLREKGVLVIGSGNLVHNLRQVNFDPQAIAEEWALEFENFAIEILESNKSSEQKINDIFNNNLLTRAHPTIEHLIPLIYALGIGGDSSQAKTLIRGVQNATISMASLNWE